MTTESAQFQAVGQPPHDNAVDVFEVVSDRGTAHCLHRSRPAAEACAEWFGAEVTEVLVHD
jgi:hypothetical protein